MHTFVEKKAEKGETVRTTVESDARTTTKESSSKSLERPVTQQSTTSLRGESRQEKVSLFSCTEFEGLYTVKYRRGERKRSEGHDTALGRLFHPS